MEKYSDKQIVRMINAGCYKPAWLQVSHNELIEKIFSKCVFEKNNNLLMNFTKKTLNYFNIKGLCIALCEKEQEKQKIETIWNLNNEFFDYVFIEKEFYKWIKNMKFDKIIMNPPYTCGKGHTDFHLEILDETRKHLNSNGKLINLSPIGWLQNATAELKKTSKYNRYKNSLCKQIKNIEVIPVLECRNLFDIGVMNNLGIYEIDNEGGFDCTSLIKRDQTSLFDKVIAKCYRKEIPSINSIGVYGKDKSEKNHCNISVFHGHEGSSDFFDVCTPQKEIVRGKTKGDRTCIINFDSDETAENFRLSLNTIFYKYLNFIYKRNQNLDLSLLPWMGNSINPRTGLKGYLSEWTDEDFYAYFEITEDEQKLIKDTMEKYK